jgi:hypothetical protein
MSDEQGTTGPGSYGPPGQPSGTGPYGPPAGAYGDYGQATQGFGGPAGPTQQFGAYPQGPYETQYGPLPTFQEPPRRRGRTLIAAIATGTAVVLTAGGVYAYSALSGGPAQLAAHTPGDAVGYVEVNLDPPAGQKAAAIRFLRKFPQAKTGDESGTLLDSVVEPLIPDAKSRRLFTEDIRTWLGKHAAVAADPQDGKVQTVVIAETTDAARTRAGLDRINAEQPTERAKVRYALAGGIVYIAETQQAADRAARDSGSDPLASTGTFGSDVDKVGDDGIVTFWSDLAAAAKYDTSADGADAEGRLAGSLRFTDTTADLRVRAIGNPTKTGSEAVGPRVAKLPADTAAAVGLSGGDRLVRSAYDQLKKAGLTRLLDRAERDSGLRLPDDVAALVGSGTIVAFGGTGDRSGLGLVSTTDDPAGARRAADQILRKIDSDSSLTVRSTAEGTVLANSPEYADQLTGDGGLGDEQLFRQTLPDLDGATAVVYVDLRRAADISGDELPAEIAALRSVGLTASTSGADSGVHIRLVAG